MAIPFLELQRSMAEQQPFLLVSNSPLRLLPPQRAATLGVSAKEAKDTAVPSCLCLRHQCAHQGGVEIISVRQACAHDEGSAHVTPFTICRAVGRARVQHITVEEHPAACSEQTSMVVGSELHACAPPSGRVAVNTHTSPAFASTATTASSAPSGVAPKAERCDPGTASSGPPGPSISCR